MKNHFIEKKTKEGEVVRMDTSDEACSYFKITSQSGDLVRPKSGDRFRVIGLEKIGTIIGVAGLEPNPLLPSAEVLWVSFNEDEFVMYVGRRDTYRLIKI